MFDRLKAQNTLKAVALGICVLAVSACKQGGGSAGGSTDLHPFTKNDLVGYINSKGEEKITPQFDEGGKFSEGLAPVRLGQLTGYIDSTGKYAISPRFQSGGDFKEGLAPVRVNNVYGFIDRSGKTKIDFLYLQADSFSEGLAAVVFGGRFGFIDKDGKLAINPRFVQAGRFSQGLAPARLGAKVGYIGKNGEFKIEPKFDTAGQFVSGLAPVTVDGKAGFVNLKGEVQGELKYAAASRYSSGLASVAEIKEKDGKKFAQYGYVNTKGEMAIPSSWETAGSFEGELALVRNGLDMGYINKKGEPVWQTKLPFPLAQVRNTFPVDNKLAGCINLAPARLIERDGGHDFTVASVPLEKFGECKCAPQHIRMKIKDANDAEVISTQINIANRVNRVANTRFRFEKEKALEKFKAPFNVTLLCEKPDPKKAAKKK